VIARVNLVDPVSENRYCSTARFDRASVRRDVNPTRKADGDDEPMRCVTAEVNGSGRVSRWYFRSTVELELIELSGGVTLTPSSRGSINFAFGQSSTMSPAASDKK
jgi:hypothetical protein